MFKPQNSAFNDYKKSTYLKNILEMISISPIHKIVSFRKAKNMERKESYKSSGTISGSSDVEYQALLAELKQKDKQREELLMNLKVCLNFIYLQYLNRLAQFSSKLALCICSFPVKTCLPCICFETALDMFAQCL